MMTATPSGHKTPAILTAEIVMHRQAHAGAFLVLEGKDDLRFLRVRHHEHCELVDGEGKANVVGALHSLDGRGFRGALGLVDGDYDAFISSKPPSANLVTTDAHDLECVLCRSRALDAVLAEYGDPAKIKRFEDMEGADVRQALLDRALAFGRLRLAATLWREKETMREIRVPRFMDQTTWCVDTDALFTRVVGVSSRDREAWRNRMDELRHEDRWFVARGHDMLEILRIGLRRVLGDMPPTVGVKDIARGLRLAMSQEWLEATGMWESMRAWEDANPPFRVLCHSRSGDAPVQRP